MVSIVIPAYNKDKFIAETIGSVLGQSFTNFELLLIDDGSTDRTYDVMCEFNDPRIRIIRQENQGVSVARNAGIEAAGNNWIAFLDADDWWAPDFLSSIMEAKNSYADHKIFASGRTLVFPDGMKRYTHEFLPEDGKTAALNYYMVISKYLPLVNSSNSCISRDLLMQKAKFRPGQRKHEDHDLWIRLAIDEEVVFVNKPLSFYRKTQTDSVSKAVYEADDFMIYLKTIHEVRSQLEGEERNYFDNYLKNFLFVTYLKNYWHYEKSDRKRVFLSVKELLSGWRMGVLQLSRILPFNLYALIKNVKG